MSRILKTFLLWLLIAALPIQGVAAVVKTSCGPDHHSKSLFMMGHTVKAAASEHQDSMAEHSHHAHPSVNSDGIQADETAASQSETKSAFCSACATCCVGAVAPPSAAFHTPEVSYSEGVTLLPSSFPISNTPSNLERPPRHFFI